jgi:uncharacterized protein (UPF0261 family)
MEMMTRGDVLVVGTCDTKGEQLRFVRDRLQTNGLDTLLVDISTRHLENGADIGPSDIVAAADASAASVFVDDRGIAVTRMGGALLHFLESRDDIAGIIGLGGSGGTSMIAPAMQRLPIGLPKIMVSAVAASDIRPYVGLSDIMMIPSVVDIDRLNRLSRTLLVNAANALAGMVRGDRPGFLDARPAVGLTTAGVTTECQERVMDLLEARFDCLSFHAAGTGGPTMEMLAGSGMLCGMLDIAPTEITDLLLDGAFACGDDRLLGAAAAGIPYVFVPGAMDCWKYRAPDTVPKPYRHRRIYAHNPEVTLVRPDAEEFTRIGHWIGRRLSGFAAPYRVLVPEGGLSSIDGPGRPFDDPAANAALVAAIADALSGSSSGKLVRLPYHINDPEFADAIVTEFAELMEL